MRLDLVVTLKAPGLVGGDTERASHLGAWASFGRYRETIRIPLAIDPVKPIHLSFAPGAKLTYSFDLERQPFRGDESIWIRLYSNTRKSGVAEIDKVDKDDVLRNGIAAEVQLPLIDLFASIDPVTGRGLLTERHLMSAVLVSQLGAKARSQQNEPNPEEIMRQSIKATATVQVIVSDVETDQFKAAKAQFVRLRDKRRPNDPIRNPITGALLFVPENYRYFSEAMNRFLETYCTRYMGQLDAKNGNITGKARFEASTPGVAGLHFAIYRTAAGILPVLAFWIHTAWQRPWATEKEREEAQKLYGATDLTENFYEVSLLASCRRYGMEPGDFIEAVAKQYARTDATVNNSFILAKCIAVDVGCFIANSLYYSVDSRYKNASRPRPANVTDDEFNKLEECESWDLDAMMLMTDSDDCEDDENVSSSVSRLIRHGRMLLQKGQWKSKLLMAAKRILDDTAFLDCGGDVTAKYVKADGSEVKKGEIKELPMKDSADDKRNPTGGHAYSIAPSLARVHVWDKRYGSTNKALAKYVANITRNAPWQFRVFTPVLEGTGAVDHLVLPAAEIYGESSPETRKAEAARVLVRDILAGEEHKAFSEAFRAYSTPFYSHKVDAKRRISGFYRNIVQAVCVETYEIDHGLSQMVFIDHVNMKRGIDLATILRDSINDPNDTSAGPVAVDFPFEDMVKEWDEHLVPVIEAQLNQMPVTSLQSIPRLRAVRPFFFGVMTGDTLGKHLRKTKEAGELSASLAFMKDDTEKKMLVQIQSMSSTLSTGLECAECGRGGKKAKEDKSKQKQQLIAFEKCLVCSSFGNALSGGNITLSPHAIVPTREGLIESSPLGATWVHTLDRSPIASGTLDWERVYAAAVRLATTTPFPLLDTVRSMSPVDDIPVKAEIAEFESDIPLSAERANELLSAQSFLGWSLFAKSQERWSRVANTATPYVINGVRFAPTLSDGTIRIHLDIDERLVGTSGTEPRNRRLTMVHLSVMGRIYALHPIIVQAGGSAFLTRPMKGKPVPLVSISKHMIPANTKSMCVQVAIHGESQFAQAFCTRETLEAKPWITVDSMPDIRGPVATLDAQDLKLTGLLAQQLPPLEFHYGLKDERPYLDVFRNAYKRDDVVLVRFVSRDWHVRKKWDTITESLSLLYKKAQIVAHEFAVCSPLPQVSDIVELHVLVHVGK